MFKWSLVIGFALAVAATSVGNADAKIKPFTPVAAASDAPTFGLSTLDAASQPARQSYNGSVYCRDLRTGLFSRDCALPASSIAHDPQQAMHRKPARRLAPPAMVQSPRRAAHSPKPLAHAETVSCSARHHSFNPRTGLYVTYDGRMRRCKPRS